MAKMTKFIIHIFAGVLKKAQKYVAEKAFLP